jgi:hypothetical protein
MQKIPEKQLIQSIPRLHFIIINSSIWAFKMPNRGVLFLCKNKIHQSRKLGAQIFPSTIMQTCTQTFSSFTEFQAFRKKIKATTITPQDPPTDSQKNHQKYFMEEKEKEKEIKRLLLLKQYIPPKPVKLDDIMMKFDYYNFEEL